MNSPAFLVNKTTDFSELSMSPLQLLDSPVQAALMTPGTSSGESSARKSPCFLKQTSTPSDEMAQDTPTNKNKAFIIGSNAFVGTKAKRRLIDDECIENNHTVTKTKKGESIQGNVAKKQKTSPNVSHPARPTFTKNKKRAFGQINSGVSHRIRRPEKKFKPSVLSVSLSDLKKAKAEGSCKNPLDALNRTLHYIVKNYLNLLLWMKLLSSSLDHQWLSNPPGRQCVHTRTRRRACDPLSPKKKLSTSLYGICLKRAK